MQSKKISQSLDSLRSKLAHAAELYYSGDGSESPMSDHDYDKDLKKLEEIEGTGHIAPRKLVGYPEERNKVQHMRPILSLKSTKELLALQRFLGEEQGLLSWKLDGVSIVLYYKAGRLFRAVTRGDGLIGSDITANVSQLNSVPKQLAVKDDAIIRGEGCISILNFEAIKRTKEGERYSNARNAAAGIVRAISVSDILLRQVTFICHTVISYPAVTNSKDILMRCMRDEGFTVVPYWSVANYELADAIEKAESLVQSYAYPTDGLVLTLNDIAKSEALGLTSSFPRDSMAYKWTDATKQTVMRDVHWSVSASGLITPIAKFEPIELEGTTVRRANLHSLKCFEKLGLGKGDVISVYKANKIVPEVEENFTRSKTFKPPRKCPACGAPTEVFITDKTKKLYCSRRCGGARELSDSQEKL